MTAGSISSFHLGDRTFREIEREAPHTLLVPLGSTEQHGPHLPLSTDTDIAVAWCEALADGRSAITIAPPLPYGSSGEHDGFAGTLSIGQRALELVLVELGRSATRTVDHIVFVSGHAGNAEPLQRAVALLQREGRSAVALLPYITGGDPHAGRSETSIMLHLDPDRVRLQAVEVGNTEPLGVLLDQLKDGGVIAVAPNGVLGDPTGATAAEGAQLIRQLAVASLPGDVDC